jgi:hypothetical protein
MAPHWTNEELEILHSMHDQPIADICEQLKTVSPAKRTPKAVKTKMEALGLLHVESHDTWTKEENDLVYNLRKKGLSWNKVARAFTEVYPRRLASPRGLHHRYEKITERKGKASGQWKRAFPDRNLEGSPSVFNVNPHLDHDPQSAGTQIPAVIEEGTQAESSRESSTLPDLDLEDFPPVSNANPDLGNGPQFTGTQFPALEEMGIPAELKIWTPEENQTLIQYRAEGWAWKYIGRKTGWDSREAMLHFEDLIKEYNFPEETVRVHKETGLNDFTFDDDIRILEAAVEGVWRLGIRDKLGLYKWSAEAVERRITFHRKEGEEYMRLIVKELGEVMPEKVEQYYHLLNRLRLY